MLATTEAGTGLSAEMITCWPGGKDGFPSVCAKLSDVGAAVITGATRTTKVTGTKYGLLPAPEEVSVTVPE